MDTNGWRSAQSGVEPTMDTASSGTDWRTQLPPNSRQRIVNKIMDTLKMHLPFSGQEALQELKQIASRFEEKIYTAATSQEIQEKEKKPAVAASRMLKFLESVEEIITSDYLRKISLKMLTVENNSQSTMATSPLANSGSNSENPPNAVGLTEEYISEDAEVETESQNTAATSLPANSAITSPNPPDGIYTLEDILRLLDM